MTPSEFTRRMNAAAVGEVVTYHVGLLARDRNLGHHPLSRAINETAKLAWAAYEAGDAILSQRRIADGVCEYRATAQ